MRQPGRKKTLTLSHIKHLQYDPSAEILEIEFHRGGTHLFYGVPEDIAVQLAQTEAKWAFFLSHIRRVYRSQPKR